MGVMYKILKFCCKFFILHPLSKLNIYTTEIL